MSSRFRLRRPSRIRYAVVAPAALMKTQPGVARRARPSLLISLSFLVLPSASPRLLVQRRHQTQSMLIFSSATHSSSRPYSRTIPSAGPSPGHVHRLRPVPAPRHSRSLARCAMPGSCKTLSLKANRDRIVAVPRQAPFLLPVSPAFKSVQPTMAANRSRQVGVHRAEPVATRPRSTYSRRPAAGVVTSYGRRCIPAVDLADLAV